MNCQQLTELLLAERLAVEELSCNEVITLIEFPYSFGVKVEEHPLPIFSKGNAGCVRLRSTYNGMTNRLSLIQEETALKF